MRIAAETAKSLTYPQQENFLIFVISIGAVVGGFGLVVAVSMKPPVFPAAPGCMSTLRRL